MSAFLTREDTQRAIIRKGDASHRRDLATVLHDGTIYVIAERDMSAVKIGYTSRRVSSRLKELRLGNPRQTRLLWSGCGSLVDEARIHRLLWPARIHSEWFHHSEVVGVAIAILRGYGAAFVASLELNMLETFVPFEGMNQWHLIGTKFDAEHPYWPEWSVRQ